ncbi:MAG: hypothetical protein ABR549_11760, partial [Mycobacteriales bacterium]
TLSNKVFVDSLTRSLALRDCDIQVLENSAVATRMIDRGAETHPLALRQRAGADPASAPPDGAALWIASDGTPKMMLSDGAVVSLAPRPYRPSTDFPGIAAWYEPDFLTGSADSARVGTLPELVRGTQALTQSAGSKQPVYLLRGQNGRASLEFGYDGTPPYGVNDDVLAISPTLLTLPQPFTVVLCHIPRAVQQTLLDSNGSTRGPSKLWAVSGQDCMNANFATPGFSGLKIDQNIPTVVVARFNGSMSDIWKNGVKSVAITGPGSAPLEGLLFNGNRDGLANSSQSLLGLVVAAGLARDSDCLAISRYFGRKYRIAVA